MTPIEKLKIYIVEMSNSVASVLDDYFYDFHNVEVVHADVRRFFRENSEKIDCLVSPANAFGIMSGGFDAALSDILGWDFQKKVQEYIKKNFYGEQPVGSSFLIKTDIDGLSLIHTPTMQYPSLIVDDMVVYHAMRSTLICALKHNIKSIVIPVFGGACGGVEPRLAAERMKEAYEQILFKKGCDYTF